ncbi:MAG: DUF4159 domain-containing protein [Endomicrobia bacterium]|nr:DUF4159 domain-containing protein [Endomicrobiia bacterium]
MRIIKNIMLSLLLLIQTTSIIFSADKFVFTQIKYPGNWDPYPKVYIDVLDIISLTTSIKVDRERNVIDITSKNLNYELSKVNFVILLGNDEIIIPHKSIITLRDFIINGGTIFIEDISELHASRFDESIRKILKIMFPEYKLKKTTLDHVLMKSFYLVRKVTGRITLYNYIEYIEIENRPAIIYSRNNIISCWAKDRLGNYIYNCIPEGELQRFNAQKLFLNIIMYSLCGTYKMDTVHQPYIQQRLKR